METINTTAAELSARHLGRQIEVQPLGARPGITGRLIGIEAWQVGPDQVVTVQVEGDCRTRCLSVSTTGGVVVR